jgi:hypothetical protein
VGWVRCGAVGEWVGGWPKRNGERSVKKWSGEVGLPMQPSCRAVPGGAAVCRVVTLRHMCGRLFRD